MRFGAKNEEPESRSQRRRGSRSISRAAKTENLVPRSTKRKRLQRSKTDWFVSKDMCNYSKGLNFKICLRAQKATGPFEPKMLTGLSRNGTTRGPSSLCGAKIDQRGWGWVGWNWTMELHGWLFSFNKWNKFTLSNRKYKVKLVFKNSLSNTKNSVFKDWDSRRK